MKAITAFEDDGTTPAATVDWPLIEAGDLSTPLTFILKNTGDEALTSPVLSIVAMPGNDGATMARIGLDPTGIADPEDVTLGTSSLALGTMAPAAVRHVVVNWIVPEGTAALIGLRQFRLRVRETFA